MYLLPVPADVRGKEVSFRCTSQQLRVAVREVQVSGDFFLPVKPDDSTWELEDAPGGGKQLRMGLCKARCVQPPRCARAGGRRASAAASAWQAKPQVGVLLPGRG